MNNEKAEKYLKDWNERESIAEEIPPIVGKLYREKGIVVKFFGSSIVKDTPIDILKRHRFARQILNNELSIRDTFPILKFISTLNITSAAVDLGRLAVKFLSSQMNVEEFIKNELSDLISCEAEGEGKPRDIVLYGFGRIGRLMARILISRSSIRNKLRLAAIVVRKGSADDLQKRASLLRRDSVHGQFRGTITVDEEDSAIIANGNFIRVIYADAPDNIDYTAYGLENVIIVDNTGKWRDRDGLSKHLKSKGVDKVILTAPGKGDLPNVVYGVNHSLLNSSEERIFTAASCTTNAIVPVLKAVHDKFSIEYGHVETCHSYTNDQNLIDNYHKSSRRGRSAPLNMVITETGAAKAVAKALPELKGKLTGNAIRVPTPNVSLAILNLTLSSSVTKEELNTYLRDISLESSLADQVGYTVSNEVVSSDFVGNKYTGIVDSVATIAEGNRAVLYVWYDNEYGYSRQVNRIVEQVAGARLSVFPKLG